MNNRNLWLVATSICFISVGLGLYLQASFSILDSKALDSGDGAEQQPLYWVAPMDPNYRRDKPGKSPMGMDLVPVYEEPDDAGTGPGTVTIAPEVVNNLGVRTYEASEGSLVTSIKTVGYVKYDEDRLVHMHPRVEGWLEKLYVKAAGDPVKKGQPIYELYSPELVNAQEELLLAINRGNEKLKVSSQEKMRALQITDAFIDRLIASKNIKQSVTFYAPQDGVVENLHIREGFFVEPGTTLLSIANLDNVWVEAEVFERQSLLVHAGQSVSMSLDYFPGREWLGEVDYVYPTLDANNRTLRVRLRFDNPEGILKPNMFAQVNIETDKRSPEVLIPNEALIRTGTQDRVVLALGDGRFKSVAVKVGLRNEEYTEITEGLLAGDMVVRSAQFLLDSESSRDSDFMRMASVEEKPESVWVEASVDQVMAEMGMLKLTHQPIEAWDWPVMTMMFPVDDDIDISTLEAGMTIHVEITQTGETDWLLTGLHIPQNGHGGGHD